MTEESKETNKDSFKFIRSAQEEREKGTYSAQYQKLFKEYAICDLT